MRRYLAEQRISCKPSTIGTYISALNNFHAFLRSAFHSKVITAKRLSSIDKSVLDNYLADLHAQRLAPYSCVNKFLAVRKYLVWEVAQNNLKPSTLANFNRSRLPKVPDYLPRPLSKETDRLLTHRLRSSGSPYAKAFLLLRLTGMRISELINLSNDCIFTTAKNERFLKIPLGKMNNERLVPLCAEAVTIIQNLKSSSRLGPKPHDRKRLIGMKGPIPRVYSRLASQFETFTEDLLDQDKRITFHRLRHTYATSLLSGGVSIVSIMKLLGHRRIEMSLRYAQITPTHLRDEYFRAIAAIEQNFLPQDKPNTIAIRVEPASIIDQLTTFVKKEANFDKLTHRKLARKLSRFRNVIQSIPIKQKFPVLPS